MDIKQEYAKRRKRQIMLAVPLIAAMILMVMAEENSSDVLGLPQEYLGIFMLIIVIAALIFSFKNWRCPGCNAYLGKRINHKFCSSCGIQLQ